MASSPGTDYDPQQGSSTRKRQISSDEQQQLPDKKSKLEIASPSSDPKDESSDRFFPCYELPIQLTFSVEKKLILSQYSVVENTETSII